MTRTFLSLVAAVLVALEGLVLAGYAGYVLVIAISGRPHSLAGIEAVAGYLMLLGVLVLLVAWGLYRERRWSRGPGVLVQLLALAVTWNMFQAGAYALGVPLGLAALVALVALVLLTARAARGS
ncbi:hypothetical protein C3Y87_13870 [Carbonactinospora thermoautotrophica]|uniref:Integral membrane protein n=2 Tax=Carbonactinospora thermoautotrophica TaxID=1469144 RepID=A0A132MNG4_9ACTN|nr:hypothetical protein [Carbonactinospora thermoautotrophica]KWW99396.1 Uncharacterized protein LI90_1031 [Carbonactinospora thermoautotrophica]KWX04156.1 hypothetical protein TH66_09675 [Carbonactinospora thermoautotrophica]MCX9192481.1 hypothetical protein [Carbonactinospora thermoautotrophica]